MCRHLSSLLLLLQLLLLTWGPMPSLQAPLAELSPTSAPCKCSLETEQCCRRFKGLSVLDGELRPCSSSWRRLDLSFNNIVTLKAFNTSTCSQLRQLILFANELNVTLDTDTFKHLSKLERLNLSRNRISMLKGSPFSGLRKLQALDLSHNVLRVLSKTTFRDLESLEVLRLFGNFIGFLEARTFASLVRLRQLDLTQNNITRLRTTSFRGLASLEKLSLQRNPMKELEPQVFSEMTNLKSLKLGICGRIGEVPRLEGNLFTKLTRLTLFNFSSCLIADIHPEAFKGLSAVRTLSLRDNRLIRINRTVWEPLVELTILDLANNQLECLFDSNFRGLSNLIELDLSGNRIAYLSDAALIGLDKLRRLRLDRNPLRIVQPGSFCRAPELYKLSLLDVPMHDSLGLGPTGANGTLNASLAALRKDAKIFLPPPRTAQGMAQPCRPVMPSRTSPTSTVCPVYIGDDPIPGKVHSRRYLLISVAVCVAFLLMALGVIMSYRAWSKRKRTACEKAEQAALEEEKQEMMAKPSAPQGGAANGGGSATKELLAAGQSAENGVVLHERYVPSAAGETTDKGEKEGGEKEEENTMTHLAVV